MLAANPGTCPAYLRHTSGAVRLRLPRLTRKRVTQVPSDKTRSKLSMRALVVAQALFLLASLGVPVATLAAVSTVRRQRPVAEPGDRGNSRPSPSRP